MFCVAYDIHYSLLKVADTSLMTTSTPLPMIIVLALAALVALFVAISRIREGRKSFEEYKHATDTLTEKHFRRTRLQKRAFKAHKHYEAKLSTHSSDIEASAQKIKQASEQLAQTQSQLQSLSLTDPLTELWNRTHFDQQLHTELRRAARSQDLLTLIIIDLDRFKAYNRVYGRQRGDVALKHIAQTLQKIFQRGGECVCRFADDMFAIIVPKSDAVRVNNLMTKTLSYIRQVHIDPNQADANHVLTASAGIVTDMPSAEAEVKTVILTALDALAHAQKQGGDQVHHSNQPNSFTASPASL